MNGNMKKYLLILILALFPCSIALAATPPALLHPDRITFKPLSFSPPKAERVILHNGLVLYLLANHELPLVKITAVIRTGGMYDPPEKEGLADLTGQVMRTGGIKGMTGSALDETLESMAANLSIATHRDSCTLSLSLLSNDREKGLELFSRVLMQPVFEAEKLALAKDLKIEELRRIADNPQKLAFREFGNLIHEGSPRGRLYTADSIGRIQRDDLVGFHRRFYHPVNVMISISGDMNRGEAEALANRYFGNWQPSGKKSEPLPLPQPRKGTFYLLTRDLTQSIVIFGWLAPEKKDVRSYPFTITDFIIGSGGFRSRIFQEIRTNQGLAYSAGSFYSAKNGYGTFGAYTLTKSESTVQVISLLRDIIGGVGEKPLTEKELEATKNSIVNSFIFSFTSADQIALQQMMIEYQELPEDYLVTYRNNVNKVIIEDVNKVTREYLDPDKAIVLIVGNEAVYREVASLYPDLRKIERP